MRAHAAAELADDGRAPLMRHDDWDVALGDYWEEHDRIGTDQDARGPHHLHIAEVRGPAPGLDPDVTPDALAASACLPRFFQAVMIDGEPYWDGGYMGNPSLFPLFYDDAPEDILLVQINPIERRETPDTVEEIANRIDEITFNAGLMHELRAIEFVERLIDRGVLQGGQGYRKLRLHKIQASEELVHYKAASKLDAEWPFLQHLRDLGHAAADAWLNDNLEHVGRRATLDLRATFS